MTKKLAVLYSLLTGHNEIDLWTFLNTVLYFVWFALPLTCMGQETWTTVFHCSYVRTECVQWCELSSLCSLENERFKYCFLPASYQRNNLIFVRMHQTQQFQQQQWMSFVIHFCQVNSWLNATSCSLFTSFHVTPPTICLCPSKHYERIPARA